jgi:hypothetical protein
MTRQSEGPVAQRLGRRAFLKGGTLLLAGSAATSADWLLAAANEEAKPILRIGLATDLHYADKPPGGTRHYPESLTKFAEAAKRFQQEKPDHIIALGDMIDTAASLETEKGYLKQVVKAFAPLPGKHHFVLGNHCVENLTKPEFLGLVGQEKSYYSFDAAGYHFVILDACFTRAGAPYGRRNFKWGDANIPPAEIQWLQADLQKTEHKTIVCVHQCLDLPPPYGIHNAVQICKLLQQSGKVLGVLQGHFHFGNYGEVLGVPYCTLQAVVEGSGPKNNAYAMLDILPGDVIRITGFRKQRSYRWPQVREPGTLQATAFW